MDYETTRRLVLEILREKTESTSSLQFRSIINNVYQNAIDKKLIQKSNSRNSSGIDLDDEDVEYVLDFMNLLLQQGVIRWGLNRSNLDPPFMSITKYGREVLTTDEYTPYDPDGYLNFIKSKITLDDTSELYLVECIQTFQRGNYLSSAVMLGVSAESIFNNVYDCFIGSLESEKVLSDFQKLRGTAQTKRRIDLVTDTIKIKAKTDFPRDLVEDFESKTNPILHLIRRLRNDVGHPSGIKINRTEMFNNLILFKEYCDESHQIMEFLKNHKIMET